MKKFLIEIDTTKKYKPIKRNEYYLFIDDELLDNEAKTYNKLSDINNRKSMLFYQAKIHFECCGSNIPLLAVKNLDELIINLNECLYVVSSTEIYDDLFLNHNLVKDSNYIFYGDREFYLYSRY